MFRHNKTMTSHADRPYWAGGAAAMLAGALIVASAGCSSDEPARDQPAPSAQQCTADPLPGFSGLDRCNGDTVLQAAAATIFSYHPAQQINQAAAFDAAAGLLSEQYHRQVGASASVLAPITGATWLRWAQNNAVVTATPRITSTDHPPDTDTRHARVVEVTQHVTGGAPEPDRRLTVYMTAAREAATAPWQISLLSVR